jgi:hypothetical protein
VDHKAMLLEDEQEANKKEVALRIAKPFYRTIDIIQEGFYFIDNLGMKNYIIKLDVPGANAVGLIFDNFKIPENGELYVFNEDQSSINGAITSINNNERNKMQVSPVKGDLIYVLYKEPSSVNFIADLEIGIVTHVYRNLYKKDKGYGDAGSCNINVVCVEGNGLEEEVRSIAMIINGTGNRICTGTLVNNTALDGTPYLLSANHCLPSDIEDLGVWSFIFDYKSAECEPSENGLLGNSIFGSELVASNPISDFALLELDNTPPESYDVYYAGWSRSIISPPNTKCLHHPHGDVMKVSTDDDSPVLSGYLTSGDDYWKVVDWDSGTTEGGSSGSPLLNQVGKVIGQLRGGAASCSNDLSDYYGAFYKSWDEGTESNERLKDWLDTEDLDVTSLNGVDLNDIVGIADVEVNPSFILYPNPAVNKIHIKIEEGLFIEEIQIMDLTGRLVINKQVKQNTLDTYTMDIQGFSKGVYQMQVFTSDKVLSKIFLIN